MPTPCTPVPLNATFIKGCEQHVTWNVPAWLDQASRAALVKQQLKHNYGNEACSDQNCHFECPFFLKEDFQCWAHFPKCEPVKGGDPTAPVETPLCQDTCLMAEHDSHCRDMSSNMESGQDSYVDRYCSSTVYAGSHETGCWKGTPAANAGAGLLAYVPFFLVGGIVFCFCLMGICIWRASRSTDAARPMSSPGRRSWRDRVRGSWHSWRSQRRGWRSYRGGNGGRGGRGQNKNTEIQMPAPKVTTRQQHDMYDDVVNSVYNPRGGGGRNKATGGPARQYY